jgi:hypothetical protein
VDGKFIDIAVGASTVWALGSNRDFYYRYTEYRIQNTEEMSWESTKAKQFCTIK